MKESLVFNSLEVEPQVKKIRNTQLIMIVVLASLGPTSISFYLPVLGKIPAELNSSRETVQLTYSLFFAAWAGGQVVYGPLADWLGRRYTLMISMLVYGFGSVICTVASSVEYLIAGRILQGLGVCGSSILARAIARDICNASDLSKVFSWVTAGISLSPALSPVLGGVIGQWLGWRMIFFVLAVFGMSLFTWAVLRMKETFKPVSGQASFLQNLRQMGTIVSGRLFLLNMLTGSILQAAWFVYVVVAPFLYFGQLELEPKDFAYIGLATAGGVFVGSTSSGALAARGLKPGSVVSIGLMLATIASTAMLILSKIDLSLTSILGPMVVFTIGLGLTTPNTTAIAMTPHGQQAGAASAVIGMTTMGISAIATTLVSGLAITSFEGMGIMITGMVITSSACFAMARQTARLRTTQAE
jgi:DHA1 family bicyclomycin/chloramphenicol resistance-like MFS transporter